MKKFVLTAIAMLTMATGAWAQNVWNMVITKNDGTQQTIKVSDIKNVSYTGTTLEDQYADQVIIKELYNGGCPKDDGSSYFQQDKGFILYNNCKYQAVVNNLCIAFCTPYNSQANNSNIDVSGKLVYASQGFIPALNGIWYFQEPVVIEPYSQIVVNVSGAIDNTQTYSQSVNYANPEYYCMYDPEGGYSNTSYYPTPADVIPTSHYLKAAKYGQGNAWPLSVTSPALFIFQVKGQTPAEFAFNADNLWYDEGKAQTPVYASVKIPNEWILDGIEVFSAAHTENTKRLTDDIDGGAVSLTNKLGHSLYRNVDKEQTEALPENAGKLVYGYSLGVGTSTDPSGIDAEASIANGAHIIYLDNNNSTGDFHERQKFSIRKN